ncbi:MAG TPA: hypothetical protein VFG14_13360 [Chthoniobacteraceae bacterium]|nr:hypothetical protein [Chthoniobacteraceae bacterium]
MKRKRIVVMGFMAGIPIAGVVWQHLHYIIGLQRLGHDVYYCEDSARHIYNPETYHYGEDYSYAIAELDRLSRRFGFENRWAFCARFIKGEPTFGMTRTAMHELIRSADAVLNICGSQEMYEDLRGFGNFLYIESDPGVEQIRIDNGDLEPRSYLDEHRKLFTFGENIGTNSFPVPLHGLEWLPTRQPVVTDFWKNETVPTADAVFTTIANWNTSGLKDVQWRDEKYLWSKSLEFLRFVDSPERCGETFEMATNIRDDATRDTLLTRGWRLTDATPISDNLDRYVDYIRNSRGEFTVAKDQYVRLNTGWFSDRTACYLAAGRPVITQETGFTRLYGGERGLFAFETADDIVEAARAIRADYALHSRAAYEIAAEHFEATKVVGRLLEQAGI